MKPSAQLLSVMYAPCLYTHADHWPAAMRRMPSGIANRRLIELHGLDTRLDFDMPNDPLLAQCIDHWARLPRVCELIGVRCLRSSLMRAPHYSRLDPVCKRFLSLPLPLPLPIGQTCRNEPVSAMPNHGQPMAAVAAGLAYVEARLARLPAALRQRLPLLFPSGLDTRPRGPSITGGQPSAAPTLNITLFRQAVSHALLEPSAVS